MISLKPRTVSCSGTYLPRRAGERLGNKERLRQKALHLSCAGHGELVFFGEFFHAQNGDNILQLPVFLQYYLDVPGYLIVFFADNERVRIREVESRGSTAG